MQREDVAQNPGRQNVADVATSPLRVGHYIFEAAAEVMLKEQLTARRIIDDGAVVSVRPSSDLLQG
jgi:hypothetical protein